MRILIGAALIGLSLGQPAAALSCLYPNMGESFNRVAAAEEVYLLVHGRLTPPRTLPRTEPGEPSEARYRFEGSQVGIGRDAALDEEIWVVSECLSVWCGGLPGTPLDILTFLERTPEGLRLTISPCPGAYLENPAPQDVSILRRCLASGRCGEAEIGHFRPD